MGSGVTRVRIQKPVVTYILHMSCVHTYVTTEKQCVQIC
jgi:hypothetical protein